MFVNFSCKIFNFFGHFIELLEFDSTQPFDSTKNPPRQRKSNSEALAAESEALLMSFSQLLVLFYFVIGNIGAATGRREGAIAPSPPMHFWPLFQISQIR